MLAPSQFNIPPQLEAILKQANLTFPPQSSNTPSEVCYKCNGYHILVSTIQLGMRITGDTVRHRSDGITTVAPPKYL